MSENKTVYAKGGIGPCFALFLVFMILKLTGVIAWSWWWVTAPLWIPLLVVAGLWAAALLFTGLFIGIALIADKVSGK